MNEIVLALVAARYAQHLTLIDMRDRLGNQSSSTLSHWETGARDPRLSAVQAWAAALGYRLTLTPIGDTNETEGTA